MVESTYRLLPWVHGWLSRRTRDHPWTLTHLLLSRTVHPSLHLLLSLLHVLLLPLLHPTRLPLTNSSSIPRPNPLSSRQSRSLLRLLILESDIQLRFDRGQSLG